MGFSISAATAIIGISILVSAEILTGSLLPTISEVNDSYNDMKNRAIKQIQTEITIVNVTTSSNGSNYDINITLENSGSVSLKTRSFNVLIDGTSYYFSCSRSYLYPQNQAYFVVTNLSGSGQKRLKIVTSNGLSDYYNYIIT